jgi:hypothetical protein
MPILTVNNIVFNYPDAGTDPGWGEDATAWAQAVTDTLATLLSPGDILETSFSIANNTAIDTNINGLQFNGASVRAANVEYSIRRTSTESPVGNVQTGTLQLTYDTAGAIGSKWLVADQRAGDAGVVFTCTDAGQIQYKSTDIGTTNYQGQIKFRARTLAQ